MNHQSFPILLTGTTVYGWVTGLMQKHNDVISHLNSIVIWNESQHCTFCKIVKSAQLVGFITVAEKGCRSKTRSTQRVQTSLAEADHYSHIAHCKNVEPWLWKTTHPPKKFFKKKVLDHYLHHDLGMLPLLRCFFAHLLILQYPDHHQNLISSSLYYSGPVHKISSQSIHNFLSNVVHRQTDRQTN